MDEPRERYRRTVTEIQDIRTDDSRTITPLRQRKPCTLTIVAVHSDGSVRDELGRIYSFDDYCEQLPEMERHLVVTFSSGTWLWKLNERWGDNPRWTWCVMTQRKPRAREYQHVVYYGFRRDRRQAFANLVMDATSFGAGADTDLVELGQRVRGFCNQWGLQLRASAPGVAGQLLRHPMFYPHPRRAVPRFINETARAHLPGPFYERYVDGAQRIEAASYIDQEAAYHYAAQNTPLPNANSIHAAGSIYTQDFYARAGGEIYSRELQKHGLLHVRAHVPTLSNDECRFAPRIMHRPGYRNLWIWTNELPYLEGLGLRVLHLISTWGTAEVDNGISKYALWAADTAKRHKHLKEILLMPYGVLGRHPSPISLHHPGGNDSVLIAGRWIEGTDRREVHARTLTGNALQLGLIQAHVRALSLDMARQLSAQGKEVISIYADGIFLKHEGEQLPLFRPWRLKEDHLELHLTDSLRVPVRAKVRRKYLAVQLPVVKDVCK